MRLDSKFIGGILLIIGTSIGGGMLALPVMTATAGVFNSLIFLLLCWLTMTTGALLVLEVNLRLAPGSNMISMAKDTLGFKGQIIAWVTYLFLLYSLLAAYISGGSDIFEAFLKTTHVNWPHWTTTIVYTVIFGLVIYSGIRTVDYFNRALMFGKLGVFLLLLLIISPHVEVDFWKGGHAGSITASLMILITSFGFASIVPSLREYFHDDVKSLRQVIIYGSFIPLVCYILWELVIMGVVARDGENGLIQLMHSAHATSGLTSAISLVVNNQWIASFFSFFTSICMITAFLGVSLGLFDFLADGLNLKKTGNEGKLTLFLTFIPPLIIVIINPGIYLSALGFAGICCVILLLVLPVCMAYISRIKHNNEGVIVPGGNIMLSFFGLIGLLLLLIAGKFS